MSWRMHLPFLLIVVPVGGAFLMPFVGRLGETARDRFYRLVPFLLVPPAVLLFLKHLGQGTSLYVLGGGTGLLPGDWGAVRILLAIDPFSSGLVLCTVLLSLSGALFSVRDMERFSGKKRYASLHLLLVSGTVGMCLAADLFSLFVFMELCSLSAAGLTAFWRDRPESLGAGFRSLVSDRVGAIFFLMAAGALCGRYGTSNIFLLAERMRSSPLELLVLAVFLVVLASRCGLFPLHVGAVDTLGEVPGGIACLMAARLQAAFCAMVRLCGVPFAELAGTASWCLIVLGGLSGLAGGFMSLRERDLRRLAAHILVSQSGFAVSALGLALRLKQADPGRWAALEAGLLLSILAALAGGLLLLCTASLCHSAGTRFLDRMGGLAQNMPWTLSFTLMAGAFLVGLPPLSGFTARWKLCGAGIFLGPLFPAVPLVASLWGTGGILRGVSGAFLGPFRRSPSAVGEVPDGMKAGMGVLASSLLAVGLLVDWFPAGFLESGARSVFDSRRAVGVPLGWNGPVSDFGYWNVLAGCVLFLFVGGSLLALRAFGLAESGGRSCREGVRPFAERGEELGAPSFDLSSFGRTRRPFWDLPGLLHDGGVADSVGWLLSTLTVLALWLLWGAR